MELRLNDLPSSNLIASRKRKLGTVRRPRKMLTQSDPNQRTRLRLLSRGSTNESRSIVCKLRLLKETECAVPLRSVESVDQSQKSKRHPLPLAPLIEGSKGKDYHNY